MAWIDKAVGCKIGTIPMVVRVNGRDKVEVGKAIRFQRCLNDRWHNAVVRRVDPDGHFQADLM